MKRYGYIACDPLKASFGMCSDPPGPCSELEPGRATVEAAAHCLSANTGVIHQFQPSRPSCSLIKSTMKRSKNIRLPLRKLDVVGRPRDPSESGRDLGTLRDLRPQQNIKLDCTPIDTVY